MSRPCKKSKHSGETAEEWLRRQLYQSERQALYLFEDAAEHGFSRRTLIRAKQVIGASSAKRDNIWYWYLTIQTPRPAKASAQNTDEFGYSLDVPRVMRTVSWLEVLKMIARLRDAGLDHPSICKQVMDFAYPNAGICESIIAKALRENGVNVPNKVLDTNFGS